MSLKDRVHYFSIIQVVMNKCFVLNLVKNLAQVRLDVFEKNAKTTLFNSEKMTSPSRRLGYSNAAFTLSGFDDHERNLLIVKIPFLV